jgi:hypothetical protein
MVVGMKLGNTEKIFICLLFLTLICTPVAVGEDELDKHTGTFDKLINELNSLQFYGEFLLSKASYEVILFTIKNMDDTRVTTQADLDYWNNLKAQYPFSEEPVYISLDNEFRLAYNYVPEGVSAVTIMDNSRNALDYYTVTKKEKGFTVLKVAPSNPNHRFRITLHKLEKMDEVFGNIKLAQAFKKYIKDQIQNQKLNQL